MPKGLVRSDPNHGGTSYRNGFAVVEPLVIGTPITEPHVFGTEIPVADRSLAENLVTWAPSPAHFGNIVAPPTQMTPTFLPAAGTYPVAQDVAITSAGADNIYYTTDGSTPTTGSTPYSGAVHVAVTETLKAIAVKSGLANSAVGSAAYTILGAAAPTFVQQKISFNGTGASFTPTVVLDAPATTGNSLFVFVNMCQSHVVVGSPTDDAGNLYAMVHGPEITGNTTGGGIMSAYLYACLNVKGAPQTITVTGGNNVGQSTPFIVAVETTSATIDDAQASTPTFASGVVTGPSLTSTAAADLLLNFALTADGAGSHAYSAGSGWALLAQLGDSSFVGARVAVQDETAGAAGSYPSTISVAADSGQGVMSSTALKGGATGVTPLVVQANSATGNGSASVAVTLAAPASAGHTVLLQVSLFNDLGAGTVTATDDIGNTYALVRGPDTSATDGFGTGVSRWILACLSVTGTPQTITAHCAGDTISGLVVAVEVSGVTAIDTTTYASTANSTSQVGATITTSSANELLIAFFGYINGSGNRIYVPGVGYATYAQFKEVSAVGSRTMIEVQQALTAGAYAVTATVDAAMGGGGGAQTLALK